MINIYGKNCFVGLKLIDTIYEKDQKLHEDMMSFLVTNIQAVNPSGLLMYLNKYKYEDLIIQYLENREYDESVFEVLDKKYLQYGLINNNGNIVNHVCDNYDDIFLSSKVMISLLKNNRYEIIEKYNGDIKNIDDGIKNKFTYYHYHDLTENQIEYMIKNGFDVKAVENMLYHTEICQKNGIEISKNENNVFLYWTGEKYKLIEILRNMIYLHSTNGHGYKVHFINDKNINKYLDILPEYFYELLPAHQADFLRVELIYKYGGIWLDSDILVIDNLDYFFDIINKTNGFFILENGNTVCNGFWGSKSGTDLVFKWRKNMINILNLKKSKIKWREIGSDILKELQNDKSFDNYKIINGLDNVYPVNWDKCVDEFINKPYENYKKLVRDFQPIIILVNSVYKKMEEYEEDYIFNGKYPFAYFLNKSLENAINNKNMHTSNIEKHKDIFSEIYEDKIWNNGDNSIPLSGPGSSIENTIEVIHLLDTFIENNKCDSVLDLGCGDLTWVSKTKFFNNEKIIYTGIDVVGDLIEKHSAFFTGKNKFFFSQDIIKYKDIHQSTLIILRDVIFHLCNDEIISIFENIKNKFKFIAITSCLNETNNNNYNKWHFSEKNINNPPFNISCKWIQRIYEQKFNRYFCVYDHDSFYE